MIDGNIAMNSHFENMSEKDMNDMHDHYTDQQQPAPKRVKIIACSFEQGWYKNAIGQEFYVDNAGGNYDYVVWEDYIKDGNGRYRGSWRHIAQKDCVVIEPLHSLPHSPVGEAERKNEAIAFLDNIRNYERESHNLIGFDERTTEELYEIFASDRSAPSRAADISPVLPRLDIAAFSKLSAQRAETGFKTYRNVPITYWTTALMGEGGELCNMIKKMERVAHGGIDGGSSRWPPERQKAAGRLYVGGHPAMFGRHTEHLQYALRCLLAGSEGNGIPEVDYVYLEY